MRSELAIVVVNFNSSDYLVECVTSLRSAGHDVDAEVVVVDNASPLDQRHGIEHARALGARIIQLEHNRGYAGGCNVGLASTQAPLVFFLNADVKATPGALVALARCLHGHPDIGLVEPRCYLDDAKQWLQPAFDLPTPRGLIGASLAHVSPRLTACLQHQRLARQLRGWTSSGSIFGDALSGAFLGTRREVLERVGGFDERYPLAYEDTDLFLRMRRAGLRLATVTDAVAIHYAHRSRATVLAESLAKDAVGREWYLRKHHGRAAAWAVRASLRVAAWLQPRLRAAEFVDLGARADPATLRLEGPAGPFVLQMAYDPGFAVFGGHLGSGTEYTFPPATWRRMLATTLYVRAFSRDGLLPRGAWQLRPQPTVDSSFSSPPRGVP